MANISAEDEANTVKTEILHYISSAPGGVSIFLAALNIVLAIVATLGNSLLLIALRKVMSIYPPTKLFFRSLAVTDLFAGLIVQPMYSITLIPGISHKNLMYYSIQVTGISGSILCTVSILTSTAISVDRLLALLLGLRYKQVVTLKRTRVVVGCIWLLSCSMGGWRYSNWGAEVSKFTLFVLMLLSLIISICSYTKIYLYLQNQQAQLHAKKHREIHQEPTSNGGEGRLNMERYKKLVSSIAWVQLALLLCFIPFTVGSMLFTHRKLTGVATGIAHFCVSIPYVLFNPALNPILYCWKIREVKQAMKETVRKLNCYFKSSWSFFPSSFANTTRA